MTTSCCLKDSDVCVCWFQGTKKEWVVEIPNLLPKTPKDLTPGHVLDGLRGNHVQKVIALKKKGWFRAFHSHMVIWWGYMFFFFFTGCIHLVFRLWINHNASQWWKKLLKMCVWPQKNGSNRCGFHMLRRCDRRSLISLIKNDSTLADRSFYLRSSI